MFGLLFITIWIVGAGITAKADAMLANCRTDWKGDFIVALFTWPVVAVSICRTKHDISDKGQHPNYHY